MAKIKLRAFNELTNHSLNHSLKERFATTSVDDRPKTYKVPEQKHPQNKIHTYIFTYLIIQIYLGFHLTGWTRHQFIGWVPWL